VCFFGELIALGVVPVAVLDAVLERGEAMLAQEQRIRAELARGLSLTEALARFGHV
jgi:hypothetical protein